MNTIRKFFFNISLISVFVIIFQSCTKVDQPNVDFTINLASSTYAYLNTKGGCISMNGVLVAQTTGGAFISVSQTCPHDGTTLTYDSGNNAFVCQSDFSTFSSNGTVTKGPANKNLKSYNTSLSGTNLHVWG